MKPSLFTLIFLFSAGLLQSVETRTEVVRAITPALDAKPLSPEMFTFAIVTLGGLAEGIDLKRADDKTFR